LNKKGIYTEGSFFSKNEYLRPMKNSPSTFFSTYSTWLGHATFAVLSVMAFVFFKERTLILDAALQSFIILRDNDFAIQVHRFGAAMTQVFPLLATKFGGSLRTILTAYSLSFVVVHWLMFWLCDRVLRQKTMAFGIVLFNVFMVNNTFYWAQNEIIQAISLNFVFWSLLLRRGSFAAFRWFDFPLISGIFITLIFFHPLIVFPFSFIALFFLIETKTDINTLQIVAQTSKKGPLSIRLILTLFFSFLILFVLKIKLMPNYYDTGATERVILNEPILNFLKNIKNAPSFADLSAHFWSDFALLPISFLILTLFYLYKKSILKLLLVWASIGAYTLMILISFREGGNWFHIESQYLPMSIFLIVPIIWDVLPTINIESRILNSKKDPSVFLQKKHVIVAISMSCVVFYRLVGIYETHNFYTNRVVYIGEVLEKTKQSAGTKFIMSDQSADKNRLLQTWGFAYETLYYSALQSPDSLRSVTILSDKEAITKALTTNSIFQGIFTPTPYSALNPRLFHQTDTVSFYKLLDNFD
jgi:hypothetical protein